MTQASLSPDLRGALGAPTATSEADARTTATSEPALWIIALTGTALVVASFLMLGMLARNSVADASFGGFVAAVSIMIAALGVGALAYVLATARRQGRFDSDDETAAPSPAAVPSGLHVVAAKPADLGALKRQALRDERSARSQQAKAIAAATTAPPSRSPVAAPRPAPRPTPVRVAPAAPPRVPQAQPRRPAPPAPARVAPVAKAAPTRVPPAQPRRPAPPAPARVAPVAPARRVPPPRTRPAAQQAIRMPQRPVRPPRPAAWPTGLPAVRMAAPPVHPRAQVPLFQVNAVNLRTPAPPYRG